VRYFLITLAGAIRVVAECLGDAATILLAISAVLWVASFALFAISYAPMLLLPRVDAGHR
jgi:uncharacterized protein involved in response to NO